MNDAYKLVDVLAAIQAKLIAKFPGAETEFKALCEYLPETFSSAIYKKVLHFGIDTNLSELCEPDANGHFELLTADQMMNAEWSEPAWVIPGLLPAGLTILGGRPKIGKSWLALQIAKSKAAGEEIFDCRVDKGRVLYLALEDPRRRLKGRMLMQGWPNGLGVDFFSMENDVKQLGDLRNGGGEQLANLIEKGNYQLVVIDTLSRLIPGDQSDVVEMTSWLTPVQKIAQELNCAIFMLDHHRKSNSAFHDADQDLLGSTAKGAMADTIWGIYREPGSRDAKLLITGREMEETSLEIRLESQSGCWVFTGSEGSFTITQRRREILVYLDQNGESTADEIAKGIGQDRGNTFKRLQDLVYSGHIVRIEREGNITYGLSPQ